MECRIGLFCEKVFSPDLHGLSPRLFFIKKVINFAFHIKENEKSTVLRQRLNEFLNKKKNSSQKSSARNIKREAFNETDRLAETNPANLYIKLFI